MPPNSVGRVACPYGGRGGIGWHLTKNPYGFGLTGVASFKRVFALIKYTAEIVTTPPTNTETSGVSPKNTHAINTADTGTTKIYELAF